MSDLQTKTDLNWKGSRWVMDLVTLARAKEPGVLPVQHAFAQNVAKTSSDSIASIMSADATLLGNEKPLLAGEDYVPSRQDQHLNIGGTNLKCSRSENILATLGQQHHPHHHLHGGKEPMDSFLNPPEYHSSQPDSLASPHKFTSVTPNKEKSSSNTCTNVCGGGVVQSHGITCTSSGGTKAAFASGRLSYASHSQSETSISVLATQCNSPSNIPTPFYSPSLHNLCKNGSDSEGSLHTATGAASDDGSTGGLLLPGQQADNVSQLSVNLSEKLSISSNNVDGSSPLPSSSPIPLDLITAQGLIINNNHNNHQRQSSSSSSLVSEPSEMINMPLINSITSTASTTKAGVLMRPLATSTGATPTALETTSVRQTKIVAVYAAYSCGLAPGTCVRLQITNHTTARQILNLLVKHLSAAVLAKGMDGPIYDNYHDFCLGKRFKKINGSSLQYTV